MIFPTAKKPIVRLIDANNWINRAFYATSASFVKAGKKGQFASMTTSEGVPTNAVKAFTNMLYKLYRQVNEAGQTPYFVLAFDIKRKDTFRAALFKEWNKREPDLVRSLMPPKAEASYKGNRGNKHNAEDLYYQVDICKEICKLAGFPVYDGYSIDEPVEADDIIGTFAHQLKGCLRLIYTRDKDFNQCLKPGVRIFQPQQANSAAELYTVDNLYSKIGIHANQFIEYLMLVGDSVDSIPGVPGCGPGTAVKLLDRWGSIENMIEKASRVTDTRERKVVNTLAGLPVDPTKNAAKEGAKPSIMPCPDLEVTRKLATILTDVPKLPKDFRKLKMRKSDDKALKTIKHELEFNSLFWV